MEDIGGHIDFVKAQLGFHERQSARYAGEPRRAAMHDSTVMHLSKLLADLEFLDVWIRKNPNGFISKDGTDGTKRARLSLSWDEIEDLPTEILEELSVSETDKAEFNILSLIETVGGVASLDRLIVGIYRASGECVKRQALNQRLYRMVQKEMIYSVPGKKGVYSLLPMTEEDAAKLL